MINTFFSENEIPKERNHYTCIAAVCIDSVLKIEKKNYPQVYLEQFKYKIKRRKPVDFIDAEVDLSSSDTDEKVVIMIIVIFGCHHFKLGVLLIVFL